MIDEAFGPAFVKVCRLAEAVRSAVCGTGRRSSVESSNTELVLTEAEREQLARWERRAWIAQTVALWVKIVLACVDGLATPRWLRGCG